MAVFKCKMCGGTIEFEQGTTVGVCDSCGTKQTLPRLDDDRRASMYDRANHFRRSKEFDKAAGIYEQILTEDTTDAEAYWSLVLCKYGIEYVKDPATYKQIPTVNRMQYTSVFDDDNYKSALEYADISQRSLYEEDAEAINEIQKGYLAISQKEDPFDVFISYKDKDDSDQPTRERYIAQEIYNLLTQEGFKVFFSYNTLDGKLGTKYEPYIFSALNSAKVMVVLGTKPEYFNATWVKNEWSRFLALVKESGGKKVLIPAYRDMEPRDLPEEFSHLQAQDMAKLGFMPDLIRGIKKYIQKDEQKQTTAAAPANASVESLLKRAFLFLEDGNWDESDEYCEKVLDVDPENAQAYLGKLMADLHVRKQEKLVDCDQPFLDNNNYKKVIRFGNEKLVSKLKEYNDYIIDRNQVSRYSRAVNLMNSARTEDDYLSAANLFKKERGYKDCDTLAKQCTEKAELCRKESIYSNAVRTVQGAKTEQAFLAAADLFKRIAGFKDADELAIKCAEQAKEKAEENRIIAEENRKKVIYDDAKALFYKAKTNSELSEQQYFKNIQNAKRMFNSISGYRDADQLIVACDTQLQGTASPIYQEGMASFQIGTSKGYKAAIKTFERISWYENSLQMIETSQEKIKEVLPLERKRRKKKIFFWIFFGVIMYITTIILFYILIYNSQLTNR